MGDSGVWVTVLVVVLVVVLGVLAPIRMLRRLRPIKNAVQGTAVVRGFSDTGTTISAPSTGAEAPEYRVDLVVSPPTGAPYEVQARQPVPRVHLPFFVPGAVVPVDIHPTKPDVVTIAFGRMTQGGATGPGAVAAGGARAVGVRVDGDHVTGADELYDKVRNGSLPVEKGSAAELLARGTRGTAVIKRAMPLGMRCGDVFPEGDPRDADDPIWMLVMVVTVPGQAPFPATVGHRVPVALVGRVQPGLRLPIAVDLADRSNEVAIDWAGLDAPGAANG